MDQKDQGCHYSEWPGPLSLGWVMVVLAVSQTEARLLASVRTGSWVSRESFTARARNLKVGNCRGPRSIASAARRPDVAWLVERVGEFLPWHWD